MVVSRRPGDSVTRHRSPSSRARAAAAGFRRARGRTRCVTPRCAGGLVGVIPPPAEARDVQPASGRAGGRRGGACQSSQTRSVSTAGTQRGSPSTASRCGTASGSPSCSDVTQVEHRAPPRTRRRVPAASGFSRRCPCATGGRGRAGPHEPADPDPLRVPLLPRGSSPRSAVGRSTMAVGPRADHIRPAAGGGGTWPRQLNNPVPTGCLDQRFGGHRSGDHVPRGSEIEDASP